MLNQSAFVGFFQQILCFWLLHGMLIVSNERHILVLPVSQACPLPSSPSDRTLTMRVSSAGKGLVPAMNNVLHTLWLSKKWPIHLQNTTARFCKVLPQNTVSWWLGSPFRIPLRSWMLGVGSCLHGELITRSEDSYQVCVCVIYRVFHDFRA